MSTPRWIGGLGLLLAIGLGAGPIEGISSTAHATSLVELSVAQLTDASELIVRGTITEVWAERDDRGRIWTRAQVEITEPLKGDAGDSIIVDQIGGVLHEDAMLVGAAARFSPGEDAIFFLEAQGNGPRFVPVGMFQGKYTVRIDPDSGQEMLVRWALRQDRPYDHRFLPHPDPAERIDLRAFEGAVLDRIELGWDGLPIPGADPAKLRRINKLQPGVK